MNVHLPPQNGTYHVLFAIGIHEQAPEIDIE
jgi:hypothetical protein